MPTSDARAAQSASGGEVSSAPPSVVARKSYTGELYGYYYSALSAWGSAVPDSKLTDGEETYVMGELYKGVETNQWTNATVRSVSYFTYRNRFPLPLANGADHDAGWGCMIRTGQMMMSEALRRVYKVKLPPQPLKKIKESELASLSCEASGYYNYAPGSPRTRTPPPTSPGAVNASLSSPGASSSKAALSYSSGGSSSTPALPLLCGLTEEQSNTFHKVAAMFYDHPSAPFGIHAMTNYGAKYAKVPCGEWFTPTALARTLVGILENSNELYDFTKQGVGDVGGGDAKISPLAAGAHRRNAETAAAPPPFGFDLRDRLAIVAAYDGVVSLADLKEHFTNQKSVLLLVPVMLGMGQLEETYQRAFLKLLECPLSLGIVGGKPKQSLYFIGHQKDTCFYLDPHTVQPAFVNPSTVGNRSGPRGNTSVANVDPSMLLCFFFDSDLEHELFQEFFFTELRPLTEYPLFSYQHQKKPSPIAKESGGSPGGYDDVVDDMDFDMTTSSSSSSSSSSVVVTLSPDEGKHPTNEKKNYSGGVLSRANGTQANRDEWEKVDYNIVSAPPRAPVQVAIKRPPAASPPLISYESPSPPKAAAAKVNNSGHVLEKNAFDFMEGL